MIISDNTERGSLRANMLLMPKKVHETENLSAKERWNTKQTYIWAEVFFFLTCDQAFFVFFLRSGLILSQLK